MRSELPLRRPDATVRLAWLDALRGVAAITVALHHASYHYLPHFRRTLLEWIDPGAFGVLVFFLVSGYIVPASLERRGSVRRFWVGRVFRIYPLLAAAVGIMLVLHLTGQYELREKLATHYHPAAVVLSHLTMMQDLLGIPSAINVLWTLSYEMAFYLLVVALFGAGQHRRSAATASTLAVAAPALAMLLPAVALSTRFGEGRISLAAFLLMTGAIALACARRLLVARVGALLGGVLALTLVLFNGRVDPWQGLAILAVMFTGTVVHRAERGQIRPRTATAVCVLVMASAAGTGLWRVHHYTSWDTELGAKRAWALAVVGAFALFAAGFALRHRHVPRWLAWLGVVSYSVYLLHELLLIVLDLTIGRPHGDQPLLLLPFLALLLAASWAAHRWIELPGQRLGRALARRVDPDPKEGVPAAPSPTPSRDPVTTR
ncbi:acyltransferase family protein [Actinomadura rupiterrae]|uniref:acyltransferase family protein n=1 Tax=Actinomadura rupiterrae TaxID=559627 RepID=UPI0020A312E9|nr:acyltransferase [Actinomadura rupiterrae]MCP2341208.1 peptidoglycan/LPS O-acetylase OafA/YrhL [Actinomadura rupiterrae]